MAPILSIGSASLVAISTLTSEINFYTRLIQMLDPETERPLFAVRNFLVILSPLARSFGVFAFDAFIVWFSVNVLCTRRAIAVPAWLLLGHAYYLLLYVFLSSNAY